ncbi:AMP-binding protein [Williamsia sp.]|uniref:AMP-binding protein n=1 Tax=Williamsia sp. TaxID=1872085 RepID=UPI002F950E7C
MRYIPEDKRARYAAEGWWSGESIGQILDAGLAEVRDLRFCVHSEISPWTGTYADVEDVARRLATGLRSRGVKPGDVVAFQLPNWMEAAATFWASSLIGAVVVPIVHIYGRREVVHILAVSKPAAFITAERFGRLVHDPEVCADVPIVGVVGRDFDDLLGAEPMAGAVPVDPDGPALIAFTSGTTSAPKGVVHTHQTLGCETRQLAAQNAQDAGCQLTATPVGHFIGMVGALLIPVLNRKPVNLMDVWDPGHALRLMLRDGLSVGGGPPYFVTSLLDHPDFSAEHLSHVRCVGLGGAAVSPSLTQRLADLGIVAFRAYGSTEHPSITGSPFDAPERHRLLTDGRPMPGVEIRLADDGEILSRGPDLFLGYTDDVLTAAAFDDEGWYRTGDVGLIDSDGCLTITDRKADIIIRGGENISALELEEVLLQMPAVAEAAVLAVRDPRLGERAAAVIRIRDGYELPTLENVRMHFQEMRVVKHKWPELIVEMNDLPRTPSGKVQKHLIRRQNLFSPQQTY